MQDTFYVKGNQSKDAAGFVGSNMVLRTQTSSDQVRGLISHGVPLYIACPGRVFRTDELDATHTPVFHQVEALAVDKNLTMADLKGVLDKLAVAMFGPEPRAACARATSHSPSRAPNSICGSPTRRAAPGGSNGAAAAWSTRMCCVQPASTRTYIPDSLSVWAWSARCCCAMTSTICTISSRVMCVSVNSS